MPTTVNVDGFYDGHGNYKIRFSPPYEGNWGYTTHSASTPALDGHKGTFVVASPTSEWNHGPVQADAFALLHADGTPHFSVGTTCYQWSSKDFAMQAQTLQTLAVGQGRGQGFNSPNP
jgi:hypothetical protein